MGDDTKAVETAEGWLYLAVILDLFSLTVVGWAMAESSDEQLVELALRMAVARRLTFAGLLHHADWGSEFTSDRYQAALRELGIEVSMSRTANCRDHAAMGSFFATLTQECTDRTPFQSRQQARSHDGSGSIGGYRGQSDWPAMLAAHWCHQQRSTRSRIPTAFARSLGLEAHVMAD